MPVTSPPHAARRTAQDSLLLWMGTAGAVMALTVWTRSLAGVAILGALLAAVGAAVEAWRLRRRRSALMLAALALCIAVVGWRSMSSRAADRTRVDGDAQAVAVRALSRVAATLRTSAEASAETGRASLDAMVGWPADAGVTVFDNDRPVAWAGRQPIPVDGLWERAGVVVGPFHTVAYAVAVRGGRRAVATMTLAAAPPADRFARPLLAAWSDRSGATFSVHLAPASAPLDGGVVILIGGQRLVLRSVALTPGALAAWRVEHARTDGLALLLFAVLLALGVLWRSTADGRTRVAVLAIPTLALIFAPLNAMSNVTRLFDPATYFAAVGGPFTASIGALMLTSGLALFAVLSARRARLGPRHRWLAAAVGTLIAAVAPFVLRDLARGVSMPRTGADTMLWIAWEVGLFLAAMSLLVAGVTLGQVALRRGRGVPLWVAPMIAIMAALLAPPLLEGVGRWPAWYPLLWIAALGALVFARRSRAVLLPSAIVAACGAVILTWAAAVNARAALAAADVNGLGAVDEGSLGLLERFADDLGRDGPPRDRADLLARYARSDLAAGGYPVALAHWTVAGPAVELLLGADGRWSDAAALADEARTAGRPLLRTLPATPIAALVLAVPHERGDVTTVLVSARTALTIGSGPAGLLGLETDAALPLYSLAMRPASTALSRPRTPWARQGDHLAAEWAVTGDTATPLRIHARVSLEPYDALVPRGALIVLFDLALVVVLWAVDVVAAGALARWLRLRRVAWRRSYRLQLTVALFAFFIVPAGVFAAWSSRRLQADDRASRELLVRETVRRASLLVGAGGPTVVGVPSDVPRFLYRGGRLIAASDSLYLLLAPLGRWLDPAVQRALGEGVDLVATRSMPIGDRQVLFGFRPLGGDMVVAVPALDSDALLDQRRGDLWVLVLLSTIVGALGALGLSGIAARRLARPIGVLRDAALAVAGGRRRDLTLPDTTVEFAPVFDAFDTMARDLAASEAEVARAQRVFAWGEMARQVAHEIKNPLTPMRLGVQHLVRAWRDQRTDFGTILEENAARVLTEIDHLDATARSFSQFGAPPEAREAVLASDVATVLRDVVALERLGSDRDMWTLVGADVPVMALTRPGELREVLINLGENARLAGAHTVTLALVVDAVAHHAQITVRDDGVGIPADVLPRVFEPHFSTRTSGSGLGLAISRRLVEEWGGSIRIESTAGVGTTVTLLLRRPITSG